MCLRSWMKTGVLQFPSNYKLALKSLSTGLTEEEEVIKSHQDHLQTSLTGSSSETMTLTRSWEMVLLLRSTMKPNVITPIYCAPNSKHSQKFKLHARDCRRQLRKRNHVLCSVHSSVRENTNGTGKQ
jgi:hypothetical protein